MAKDGDYVRYDDYAALQAKYAEAMELIGKVYPVMAHLKQDEDTTWHIEACIEDTVFPAQWLARVDKLKEVKG